MHATAEIPFTCEDGIDDSASVHCNYNLNNGKKPPLYIINQVLKSCFTSTNMDLTLAVQNSAIVSHKLSFPRNTTMRY